MANLSKKYLTVYNLVQATGWVFILLKSLKHPKRSWEFTKTPIKIFETGALLETLHAALGLVNSPISTTFGQTAARLFVMYGVVDTSASPKTVHRHPLLFSLIVSWALADIIRYLYYIWNDQNFPVSSSSSRVPESIIKFLKWLRYTAFMVLYPTGILSEIGLVFLELLNKKYRRRRHQRRSEIISTLSNPDGLNEPENNGIQSGEIHIHGNDQEDDMSKPDRHIIMQLLMVLFLLLGLFAYPTIFRYMLSQRSKYLKNRHIN